MRLFSCFLLALITLTAALTAADKDPLALPEAASITTWKPVADQWIAMQVKQGGAEHIIGWTHHVVTTATENGKTLHLVDQTAVAANPMTGSVDRTLERSLWSDGALVRWITRKGDRTTALTPAEDGVVVTTTTGGKTTRKTCPTTSGATPDPLTIPFVAPLTEGATTPLWAYDGDAGTPSTGIITHDGTYTIGSGRQAVDADCYKIDFLGGLDCFYETTTALLVQATFAKQPLRLIPYDNPTDIIPGPYEFALVGQKRDEVLRKAWKNRKATWSNALFPLQITAPKGWKRVRDNPDMCLTLESADGNCALILAADWYGSDIAQISDAVMAAQREGLTAGAKGKVADKAITIAGNKGREFTFKRKHGGLQVRVWIQGEHAISVQAIATKDADPKDVKAMKRSLIGLKAR